MTSGPLLNGDGMKDKFTNLKLLASQNTPLDGLKAIILGVVSVQ